MNHPCLLFAGADYYPTGGWGDYQGSFATELEATRAAAKVSCDWWQIVDLRTLTVVSHQ